MQIHKEEDLTETLNNKPLTEVIALLQNKFFSLKERNASNIQFNIGREYTEGCINPIDGIDPKVYLSWKEHD